MPQQIGDLDEQKALEQLGQPRADTRQHCRGSEEGKQDIRPHEFFALSGGLTNSAEGSIWCSPDAAKFPMTETLEARRKRLIHRSLYTGMKETDLLLGAFARAHVPAFSADQLERYERLLDAPDPDVFDWATGRAAVPGAHDHDVFRLLRNFKVPF